MSVEWGDYSNHIQNVINPYFESERAAGKLKQGKDTFSILFDYTLSCSYTGEVNDEGQAHGYGVGDCGGSSSVTGTFMYGVPHGVISV